MKISILDSSTLGDDLDLTIFSELGECKIYRSTSAEELIERIADIDIVITNKVVFNKEVIDSALKLKLICLTATGFNNIDTEHAKSKGIAVANVAGYSTESVAQHTFAMALSLLEQIPWYDNFVKSKKYQELECFTNISKPWNELKGKKWGIIGLGAIGRKVAAIAEAFGCKVSYYSTSGKNYNPTWPQKNLDKLLTESDIISIHAPLNSDTESLLGYKEFCMMKKSSILINVGRGPIIVESELAKAIDADEIAGAAIDVFTFEPMEEGNKLLSLKNPDRIILTPHNGWGSTEARTLLIDEVAENIKSFIDGKVRNRVV